jgi:SAM-dependent methyltransferase
VPGAREFHQGGRQAAAELTAVLEAGGWSWPRRGAVLDFGCGSGRVMPHVARLAPGASCTGVDVDARAIEWAARLHPLLRWAPSEFRPPLQLPDRSFDLVYSISVFSHLGERLQHDWLRELHRVLTPGGVALLSVHGPHAFEQFRTGAVSTAWCDQGIFAREPLAGDEFVFTPYRRSIWNQAELPGVGSEYGLAFHGEGYVREHWGPALTVQHVAARAISGWQDVVLCRRAGE